MTGECYAVKKGGREKAWGCWWVSATVNARTSPSRSQPENAILRSSPRTIGRDLSDNNPSAGGPAAAHGIPGGTQPHTVCEAAVAARMVAWMPTEMWLQSPAAEVAVTFTRTVARYRCPTAVSPSEAGLSSIGTPSLTAPAACSSVTREPLEPGASCADHAE
eukprot:scaffold1440_cov114-Isochrysis_galbana.AAC.11